MHHDHVTLIFIPLAHGQQDMFRPLCFALLRAIFRLCTTLGIGRVLEERELKHEILHRPAVPG